MKKIYLAPLIVMPILIISLFLYYLPVTPAGIISENMSFESSENIMFREEKTYYPLSGMVVKMENETIPLGIAGQTNEINFGRIPLKAYSRKYINVNSNRPAKIEIHSFGNITEFMDFPEHIFVENEEKKIRILFNGTEEGNFTGTLLIRNIIPKNFFSEKILRMIL